MRNYKEVTMKNTAIGLQTLYANIGKMRSPPAELLNRARTWEKFIVSPELGGDPCIDVFSSPIHYADQLAEFGLFKLPYPEMVVQSGPFGRESKEAGPPGYFVAFAEQNENHIIGRVFWADSEGCNTSGGTCIMPINCDRTSWSFAPGGFEVDPGEKYDETDSRPEDLIGTEKAFFAMVLFQLVGLCSSDGVIEESVKAPKFINSKREAKGKPPLFSYRLLKIDPARVRMPGMKSNGGTHASPRLHWRRGHIRRYASGGISLVRPCLVGCSSRGEVQKDYVIATSRELEASRDSQRGPAVR
jgi:hypothetical protein